MSEAQNAICLLFVAPVAMRSTVMSIPIAVFDRQSIPATAWGWLIALGFAQLASQMLTVVAYRYASAEELGPLIYSVIAFTALIDWIVWAHSPTPFACLGMALIGGGLVAGRARGSTAAPPVRAPGP